MERARTRSSGIGHGITLVALAMVLAAPHPAVATLSFQRPTNLLGFATTFQEGTGLPTRNFTMSFTVQSSCGRERFQIAMCDFAFYFYQDPSTSTADVGIDYRSHSFSFGNHSVEDLFMQMRTWSIVYDDARKSLSLYVDEWCLGTINDDDIFGRGTAIFGPGGIATLYLGPYGYYADGVITAAAEDLAFYGLFDSFQLWDRAMNATEISKLAASPHSLSGNEQGLAVFWRTDAGHGKQIRNLGSAGVYYAGILGAYASGIGQTSSALGVECDAVAATPPQWVNSSAAGAAGNSAPIAHDQLEIPVIESVASAATSSIVYFSGTDDDGDLLNFAVTRLPAHGVLELESTLGTTETTVITNTTFRCWEVFSRYRLVWWPKQDSNDPATVGIKAFDGKAWSAEATISFNIIPIDGLPSVKAHSNYSTDEDTGVGITLRAEDVDSSHLSFFITELPTHGKLYNSRSNTSFGQGQITNAFSAWDILQPMEQYASNVRAVSTFWRSGEDAGNGYPSWHPFREYLIRAVCCASSFFGRIPDSSVALQYCATV